MEKFENEQAHLKAEHNSEKLEGKFTETVPIGGWVYMYDSSTGKSSPVRRATEEEESNNLVEFPEPGTDLADATEINKHTY